MLISEIASVLHAKVLAQGEDLEVNTIVYDSRKATGSPNELFIALSGSNHDGHEYISSLIERGSKNFLVAKENKMSTSNINILLVDDVMAAFGVFFIYFVTMMILAGLLRMVMGFYDKFSGSKS